MLLRWAGSKRNVLSQLLAYFPSSCKNYYEPFVGTGIVFQQYASRITHTPYLSDANCELITTYQIVQTAPHELINRLRTLIDSEEEFYRMRDLQCNNPIEQAARFIYLNRTCFNGMYRVNRKGRYNVGYGRRNIHVCDIQSILQAHLTLRKAVLTCSDFADAVQKAQTGDVVYCDPPYWSSAVVKYTANEFTWNDCLRLQKVCHELDQKGVYVIVSNIDHPRIRMLFDEINFNVHTIEVRRSIASNAQARRVETEIVAVNY